MFDDEEDDSEEENESADAVARSRDDNGVLVTDTYFGGEGKPDGPGHGHVVTDEYGNVRYARDSEENMPGTTREDRISINEPH